MSDTHQLKRGLKNRHVQLLAIGGAIGTGLFLGSGRHSLGRSIHYIRLPNNRCYVLLYYESTRRIIVI